MGKKLLALLVLTVLVASALVGCSGGSPCSSTLTVLSISEGDVLVMKGGTDSWEEAQVGMSLESRDSIKTGSNSSAEITFFDGSTIELEAGAEIEIVSLDIAADCSSKTITLDQTIGTTISRVTKLLDPASSYEVETPTGVAAVRGSVLIVHVGGNGTTWLTNQQGDIWAIAKGVELQIPEEQTGIIAFNQTPELIPATDARINIQIDTGPTASIFIWDDVTNGWAIDEDTQELVDGTNHVTSDIITVAGGHYYYVWVKAANVTYDVKSCPKDWSITSAPEGDGEAACGYTVADSLGSVHFTIKT
jgi:hypothetical protein